MVWLHPYEDMVAEIFLGSKKRKILLKSPAEWRDFSYLGFSKGQQLETNLDARPHRSGNGDIFNISSLDAGRLGFKDASD